MRETPVPILLVLVAAIGGCGQNAFRKPGALSTSADRASAPKASMAHPAGAADTPPVEPGEQVPTFSVVDARKMVYTGDFVMVVGEIRRAQSQLQDLAESMGGYLDTLSSRKMAIRVPAARFNEAVRKLDDVGSVTQRDIRAQDVTNRSLDLETRLANAKAMADRLRELVAKAEKVEDALKVEQELTRLLTEIDKLEGALRLLENQVAFATLSIQLQGAVEYVPPKLNVKLPIRWLKEVGLQELLRFGDREIY
ncbi:MAG: DUF4349 domain-containing protein [Phycisphaerae bacterium]